MQSVSSNFKTRKNYRFQLCTWTFSFHYDVSHLKRSKNQIIILLPYYSQMKIVALNDFPDMAQRTLFIYFNDYGAVSSNVFKDDLELGYYYQKQLCKTDNAPKDKGSKPLFLCNKTHKRCNYRSICISLHCLSFFFK